MGKRANTLDAQIRALPGIEQAVFRAGQVLIYEGHYPPGLFLVVSGCVVVEDPGKPDSGVELDADAGSFLFPGLNELDLKVARTVRAQTPVEMLIAPRSQLKIDGKLRQLFQSPDLVQVSLQAPARGMESE